MLKGGWLPGIAIVLILLFAIWVGLRIGYQDGYGDGGDDATAYQQIGAVSDGASPEAITPYEQSKREEWRDVEDLNAQRTMAYWAAAMFAAAIGTIIVTGLGVIYVAQTLDATRAALDEAKLATKAAQDAVGATRDVGKIQARAYLLVIQTAKLKFQGDTRTPVVQATIKNKGQTPATAISVRADVVYPKRIGTTQICPEVISFDLAPDDDYIFEYAFPAGALPPIEEILFPLDFTVIVRISYETAFGSTESEKFPFAIQYIREKDLWNLNWTSRILTEAERKRFEERSRLGG